MERVQCRPDDPATRRMVRLKDIAAQARVSVMTVSKALRDSPDISVATRARLQKLAQEMGYVPDSMARGLRTGNSRLFGLVVTSITNPIYARIVLAIQERAHEMGYDVLLAQTLSKPEQEAQVIRRLLTRQVDGLFLTPAYRLAPAAPIYEELRRRGTHVVILGHLAAFCTGFPNVETDDLTASLAVTRHLIELGHRRIAYFCGPVAAPSAQERYQGYRQALREAQIEVDDRLIFQSGVTIEEGQKAALQWLHEAPGATAIQAANDLVAIGAANVLLDQGVKIPQELSVAGFGNVLTAEYFRVPLTTVRQPKLRLGVAAMDSMVKLLQGERPGTKRLSAELIIRQSTAPPPNPVEVEVTRL